MFDECLHKLKMVEYDRIDLSARIDFNKTSALVAIIGAFLGYILKLIKKYITVVTI